MLMKKTAFILSIFLLTSFSAHAMKKKNIIVFCSVLKEVKDFVEFVTIGTLVENLKNKASRRGEKTEYMEIASHPVQGAAVLWSHVLFKKK